MLRSNLTIFIFSIKDSKPRLSSLLRTLLCEGVVMWCFVGELVKCLLGECVEGDESVVCVLFDLHFILSQGQLVSTDIFAVEWTKTGDLHMGLTVAYYGFMSDGALLFLARNILEK